VAPFMARVISLRLDLSNQKALAEMGWRPRYPDIRAGLAQVRTHAA